MFKNKHFSGIPAFVFNRTGMLAFLAESMLCFFMPRISKRPSKCSVEFFTHLLQPVLSFLARFTTQRLTRVTDALVLILRPIQWGLPG